MIDRVVSNNYLIILIFWCLIMKSELIPDTNVQFCTGDQKFQRLYIPNSPFPVPNPKITQPFSRGTKTLGPLAEDPPKF